MAKDKLLIPVKKNLFDDFLKNHLKIDEDSSDYFKGFTEEQQRDINLLLRRIRLSDNIHSDDLSTKINKGISMFEDGALRMHLYLTCIESLARILTSNSFLTFGSWMNAKKEPYKSQKETVVLTGKMNHQEVAKCYLDKYNSLHGTRTMFYHFFTSGLNEEQRNFFVKNMFVIESNPLPKVYHINPLTFNYDKTGNVESDYLIYKRLEWESLNISNKLELIAKAFYKIRNHYTHSLIPYTSVQDKTVGFPKPEDGILDKGDTVFVWEDNIAIGSYLRPLNKYLKDITIKGVINYIKLKKENNKV